jgi:hypothetical protein
MGTFAVNKGYWDKCWVIKRGEEYLLKMKEKMEKAIKEQKIIFMDDCEEMNGGKNSKGMN